ncbi:hypothetical protein HYN04_03955 [Phenylobacterium parvum]|uniref:Uncharacterized protein n=1 Tax=Phenylobacterium parvum TaxID=2201350 RepID=A0A2Z3HNX4_9CAUL|nr:hypothetical protein HYN04_03955 [Phenylobacterium parvum]
MLALAGVAGQTQASGGLCFHACVRSRRGLRPGPRRPSGIPGPSPGPNPGPGAARCRSDGRRPGDAPRPAGCDLLSPVLLRRRGPLHRPGDGPAPSRLQLRPRRRGAGPVRFRRERPHRR